jgi:uncharacterized protein (TIGR00252 family)
MTENINSTKYIGDIAEDQACKYLKKNKYKIIDRNWRTRYCEVDIIAEKDRIIYFVEVKYRRNNNQGGGLAAVNLAKQKQMAFAAEIWISNHGHSQDAYLAVISLGGDFPKVEDFIVIN